MSPSEPQPRERLSLRARVAQYLVNEVGEGNIFTMNRIRGALPGFSQVDRRMRELREVGWIISGYRDRSDLAPDQYRLDKIGAPIWDPDYRPSRRSTISAATKRTVFERDVNRCTVCGVGAGEPYPDNPGRIARLTVGHWVPKSPEFGGTDDPSNLRTECSMCNETTRHLTGTPVDTRRVKALVKELPRRDRTQLLQWMQSDRRSFDKVDEVWSLYRQLSGPARDEVRQLLGDLIGGGASE